MLACRLCRVALNAQEGCSICNEWRKNFVYAGDTEDERPSLSGVGAEVVGDLRLLLKSNRERLKANSADEGAQDQLLAIGNTLSKVLESARKLQADGVSAVANMSFKERAELFITWYTGLPAVYRVALREQMAKFELETGTPIKELPDGTNSNI